MIKYEVKKSDLSVEGYFASPAFNLFRGNSDVLEVVAAGLSDLCPVAPMSELTRKPIR